MPTYNMEDIHARDKAQAHRAGQRKGWGIGYRQGWRDATITLTLGIGIPTTLLITALT